TVAAADKMYLRTSDDRLERAFKNDPEFAPLRNPDGSVNRDTLTALGMSSEAFAERLRQDLTRRQVMERLGDRAGGVGVGCARRDVPAARGPGRALRRQGPARQGCAERRRGRGVLQG